MNFLERAAVLTQRNIPVIPLLPESKIAFQESWPSLATTNQTQIEEWNQINPNFNTAAVAKAQPDGIWIFEIDRDNYHQQIERETGQKLPVTFMVRSSPGRGHFFFRHTAKSIALGNRQAKDSHGEIWSARTDNRYCVGAKSIHPKTKREYEIVGDNPVVEAPDWLIEFISKQSEQTKTRVNASVEGPKIPLGSHDTELFRIASLFRNAGMDQVEMTPLLIEICEKRCEGYGSDYVDMCQKKAQSACKYPVGSCPTQLILNQKTGQTQEPANQSLKITSAASVKPRRIKWLWGQRVPYGKLTVFSGDPDQAKSLVSLYVAANITNGEPMYGDETDIFADYGEVLILAAEDEPSDVIVPRLMAAGAELSRVHILESVTKNDGEITAEEREIRLDYDIKQIEAHLKQHPKIKLVIIDPISSYLGDANMNAEQEVREVLNPLKQLAARTNVAVIMIMHFSKKTDVGAVHKVGGAVAFTGVARAVWAFMQDPSDLQANVRKMLKVKANIARPTGGLSYAVKTKVIRIENEDETVPYVEFIGTTDVVANDLILRGRPAEKSKDATTWLNDFIGNNGAETAEDVQSFGKKAGHSLRTLYRAKEESGFEAQQYNRKWYWTVPGFVFTDNAINLKAPPNQ